jgi:hypothetical protein
MNAKLKDLIAQAAERMQAVEDKQLKERNRIQREADEKAASAFKGHIERALGSDVLAAIGPISFDSKYSHSQAMLFEQGERKFRVQQQTGELVNLELEMDNGYSVLIQFNLNNADSRDRFLLALGAALTQ